MQLQTYCNLKRRVLPFNALLSENTVSKELCLNPYEKKRVLASGIMHIPESLDQNQTGDIVSLLPNSLVENILGGSEVNINLELVSLGGVWG